MRGGDEIQPSLRADRLQSGVARFAGAGLETRAPSERQVLGVKSEPMLLRKPADLIHLEGRLRPQPMVQAGDLKPEAKLGSDARASHEQRRGIRSARDREENSCLASAQAHIGT